MNEYRKPATIGIIGYGIVGKATEHVFEDCVDIKILRYDKYQDGLDSLEDVLLKSDFLFLCLPTPFSAKTNKIDLSAFEELLQTIDDNNASGKYNQVTIIKSTVVPGTTVRWEKQFPNTTFVFCPEFLTEKNFLKDAKNPDRFVVGATDNIARQKVIDLHAGLLGKRAHLLECSPTEAELGKYASNCFLASKVTFANEMSQLCDHFGISWNGKPSWILSMDKRVGISHLHVSKEKGFSGKCFPKDMIALLGLMEEIGVDSTMLSAVWEKNLKVREKHDWNDIPFVRTEKD